MFTISCYSFHPLVKRFLTLWRYAQIVSDWLTFFLSCLCCQCGALMPFSNPSSAEGKPSIEAFKIMSEPIIEAGRASGEPFCQQHLVLDFTPQAGDSEEAGLKCQQFWEHLSTRSDLEGMVVLPDNETRQVLADIAVPVHRSSSPHSNEDDLPALRIMRSLNERGAVDTAFAATSECRSKH